AARVPIVVAMGLFDLAEGDPLVRPGAAQGLEAARAAVEGPVELGAVGAGTGATVGKWRGPEHRRPGGLGGFVVRRDDVVVAALVAVNAWGDIDDGTATAQIAAGDFAWPAAPAAPFSDTAAPFSDTADGFTNTTIGLVVTNAR